MQRPPVPGRAGSDDDRVTAAAHRSVAGGHHQLDALAAQRHIGDLARFDDELTVVDGRVDRVGDSGWHPVPQHLPLPQIFAQEPALVLPPQRLPQPGGTRPHRVDHLPPVHTGVAGVREVVGQRRAQLLQRDPGGERVEMRQLRGRAGGPESARECAVARQQRDGGAARGQMQRDVDAGESRTDHQDVVGPARTEGIQCAGRPWIQDDSAVSAFGQHRGEGTFQRVGHAAWRAAGCEHHRVGRQLTTIVERQPNRGAGRQLHHLGGLDSHVGLDELVLQVTAVGESRRETFGRGDGSLVEPTGEVIGIVRPGRHPRRGNVQQMRRVVGAVGRAGAGAPRGVDQGDLRVRLAAAQMHRGEHTRGSPADNRDPHHCGRLSCRSEYAHWRPDG